FLLRGYLLGPALGAIRPVPSEWGGRFGSGALHFALGFFGKGLPWSFPRLPFRSFFASVVRFRHQSSIFCKCTLFKGLGPFPLERSEEHTSELQSRENLVCRLLLEKKKKKKHDKSI